MEPESTDRLSVPFPRSFWVVPGLLLAGFYPGDPDALEARKKLHALLDAGIRCFVDLTHERDLDHHGRPMVSYQFLLDRVASERGLKVTYSRHQVLDTHAPSPEEMTRLLDDIDAMVAARAPVYVHCWGGRGRTGTVVGCYLVRHGLASGREAIAKLAVLRTNEATAHIPAPDTSEQRRRILDWRVGQ